MRFKLQFFTIQINPCLVWKQLKLWLIQREATCFNNLKHHWWPEKVILVVILTMIFFIFLSTKWVNPWCKYWYRSILQILIKIGFVWSFSIFWFWLFLDVIFLHCSCLFCLTHFTDCFISVVDCKSHWALQMDKTIWFQVL